MLLHIQFLSVASLLSTLALGRPFEYAGARPVVPRGKSYAVVNVGGDSSTPTPPAPPPVTSIVKTTTTVEVVQPGKTVTKEVTTTVAEPYPVPAPTSCSSSESSSSPTPTPTPSTPSTTPTPTPTPTPSTPAESPSTPVETPKPIIITVTVSEKDGPTQYYDNGMWHTYYEIKTFEAAAAAAPSPAAES